MASSTGLHPDSIILEVAIRSIHAGGPLFAVVPPGDQAVVTAALAGKTSETQPLLLARGSSSLVWRSNNVLRWQFSAREWSRIRNTAPTLKLQVVVERFGSGGRGAVGGQQLRFPAGFALVDLRGTDFTTPHMSSTFERALPLHPAASSGCTIAASLSGGATLNADFLLYSGRAMAARNLLAGAGGLSGGRGGGAEEEESERRGPSLDELPDPEGGQAYPHPEGRGGVRRDNTLLQRGLDGPGRVFQAPPASPGASASRQQQHEQASPSSVVYESAEDALPIGPPGSQTQKWSLEITLKGVKLQSSVASFGTSISTSPLGSSEGATITSTAPLWLSYKIFGVLAQSDVFSADAKAMGLMAMGAAGKGSGSSSLSLSASSPSGPSIPFEPVTDAFALAASPYHLLQALQAAQQASTTSGVFSASVPANLPVLLCAEGQAIAAAQIPVSALSLALHDAISASSSAEGDAMAFLSPNGVMTDGGALAFEVEAPLAALSTSNGSGSGDDSGRRSLGGSSLSTATSSSGGSTVSSSPIFAVPTLAEDGASFAGAAPCTGSVLARVELKPLGRLLAPPTMPQQQQQLQGVAPGAEDYRFQSQQPQPQQQQQLQSRYDEDESNQRYQGFARAQEEEEEHEGLAAAEAEASAAAPASPDGASLVLSPLTLQFQGLAASLHVPSAADEGTQQEQELEEHPAARALRAIATVLVKASSPSAADEAGNNEVDEAAAQQQRARRLAALKDLLFRFSMRVRYEGKVPARRIAKALGIETPAEGDEDEQGERDGQEGGENNADSGRWEGQLGSSSSSESDSSFNSETTSSVVTTSTGNNGENGQQTIVQSFHVSPSMLSAAIDDKNTTESIISVSCRPRGATWGSPDADAAENGNAVDSKSSFSSGIGGGELVLHVPTGCKAGSIAASAPAPLEPFGRITVTASVTVQVPPLVWALLGDSADGVTEQSQQPAVTVEPINVPLGVVSLHASEAYTLALNGGGVLRLPLKLVSAAAPSALLDILGLGSATAAGSVSPPTLSLRVLPHAKAASSNAKAPAAGTTASASKGQRPAQPSRQQQESYTSEQARVRPEARTPAPAAPAWSSGPVMGDDEDVEAVMATSFRPRRVAADEEDGTSALPSSSPSAQDLADPDAVHCWRLSVDVRGIRNLRMPSSPSSSASSSSSSFTPIRVRFGLSALGPAVALEKVASTSTQDSEGDGLILQPSYPHVPPVLSGPPVLVNPTSERVIPRGCTTVAFRLTPHNLAAALSAAPLVVDVLTPHRPASHEAGGADSGTQSFEAAPEGVAEPLPGLFQVGSAAVGHLARVLLEQSRAEGGDDGEAAAAAAGAGESTATEALLAASRTLWRCPLSSKHYTTPAACERSIARALSSMSPAAKRRALAATAGRAFYPIRVRACDAWVPVVAPSSAASAGITVVAQLRLVLFCEDFGLASATQAVGSDPASALVRAARIRPSSIREALGTQARREQAALLQALAFATSSSSSSPSRGGPSGDAAASAISGEPSVDLGGLGAAPAAASASAVGVDEEDGSAPVLPAAEAMAVGFGATMAAGAGAPASSQAPAGGSNMPSRALLDPLLLSIAAREEAAWAAWRSEAEREWTAAKAAAEAEWRSSCENSYASRLTALETAWAEREGERQTAVALAQENIARIEAKLRRLLAAAEAKERDAERLKDAARASAEIRMLDINSLAKRLREDAEHASSMAKQKEAAAAARVAEMSAEVESLRAQCGRLKADNDALTTALARGPEAALRDTLATVQAEAAALQRTIAEHKANAESERRAKEEARVQVLRLAREVARLREEARARDQAEQQRLKVAYLAAEERYVLEGDRALLRGIRREVDSIAGIAIDADRQVNLNPHVASAAAQVASAAGMPTPLAAAPPASYNHAPGAGASAGPASGDAAHQQELERLKRERRNLMAPAGSGGGGYTASHPLVLAIDRQIMALREEQQLKAQQQAAKAAAAVSASAAVTDDEENEGAAGATR